MKFVVDEMPTYAEDCPFCRDEDHLSYFVCEARSVAMRCPYFSPEWGYESAECPFLISMQDLKNNA
jgi:hypothetical protein